MQGDLERMERGNGEKVGEERRGLPGRLHNGFECGLRDRVQHVRSACVQVLLLRDTAQGLEWHH